MLLRSLIALLILASPTFAAPGDPWEGTWRGSSHKTFWLFQDGNRVWGENTRPYWFEGRTSPDGRTVRGTWFRKSHSQGLFEFTLSADGQNFTGSGGNDLNGFPLSSAESWNGVREDTNLERAGFFSGDGTLGNPHNPNDPAHVAWINFEAPFPQPDAPTAEPVDISDLPVPSPGTAGLWQVLDTYNRHVGTAAMDRTADGSFIASGQIRMPDFQGGVPLLATFTESGPNTALDEVYFQIVQSGDTQSQIVNTRPDGPGRYTVAIGDFLGVADYRMALVQIADTAPVLDISQLETPEPGNLGLMRVTARDHGQIGTVNWHQREASSSMTGQIVIPEVYGTTPLDISILDSSVDSSDNISLTVTPQSTGRLIATEIRERDGDQYTVTIPAGTFDPDPGVYVLNINFIAGSRPGNDSASDTDSADNFRLDDFRIATDRVLPGLAVAVFQEPETTSSVIGMFQRNATGLSLWGCVPALSVPDSQLTGEDLYNVMADRFCKMQTPYLSGWVGGEYITR